MKISFSSFPKQRQISMRLLDLMKVILQTFNGWDWNHLDLVNTHLATVWFLLFKCVKFCLLQRPHKFSTSSYIAYYVVTSLLSNSALHLEMTKLWNSLFKQAFKNSTATITKSSFDSFFTVFCNNLTYKVTFEMPSRKN